MGPVLVFGHRNPDNDSVCSAVAYAHLKNLTAPGRVYVPVRLGPAPVESRWVFERFGVELPEEVSHVRTRVRDVMTEDVVTITPERPMLEAGRLMREHGIRTLPVVDEAGTLVGIVSQRSLAERYLEEFEIAGFSEMPVKVSRLVRVLDGELLSGDPDARIAGDVLIGAAEPETIRERIQPGDVLIVGDRVRTQPMALTAGVAALVLSGSAAPAPQVVELARVRGAALITTPQDAYSAARLVGLAHAVGDLMATDVMRLGPETLLAEAAEDLLASPHREAVVVDADEKVIGIVTRTNVARGVRRAVVLVDHNESAQSALGIEEADVLEIVDHHRVGDIQTSGPILFLNLPVGSTATIVALRYEQLGVRIPEAMAAILLAALLTDTVILKSPTTTETDRDVCHRLAQIAGLDWSRFGMDVFRAREAGTRFSPESLLTTDIKEFHAGDTVMAIAQYEAVELTRVLANRADVLAEMESLRAARGYDLVVLMATDIVREGSEVFAVGKTRLLERGLGVELVDGSVWLPGVLSRKKQMAAPLVEAAGL